jgi:hypothetical protein
MSRIFIARARAVEQRHIATSIADASPARGVFGELRTGARLADRRLIDRGVGGDDD